jgi:hypothetical protein
LRRATKLSTRIDIHSPSRFLFIKTNQASHLNQPIIIFTCHFFEFVARLTRSRKLGELLLRAGVFHLDFATVVS